MGIVAITLHDLRFRARQFLIAVAGAGLVFAMGLLLSGMVAGFTSEIHDTVAPMGARAWVVASGTTGRVVGLGAIPEAMTVAVANEPGVGVADPVIVVPQAAQVGNDTRGIIMIGSVPGGLGSTRPDAGRAVRGDGEAVVDTRLGLGLGARFTVSDHSFTVVGTIADRTLLAGESDVYVTLHDTQVISFGGRALVSAVLTSGVPTQVPAGLSRLSNAQIERATLNQLAPAVSSIDNSRVFMWVIAAFIVAALVYVTALERTRDFAVLKALGSSSLALFIGLAIQAVLVALVAAAVAAVIANFMTGLFAQPVDIPHSAFVVLPVAALVVGLLSSLAALRRAVSADPAVAFAGG